MIELLHYKYRASRRNKMNSLVVWVIVFCLLIVMALLSFSLVSFLLQNIRYAGSKLSYILLFSSIFIINMNLIQSGPLKPSFAREWEYFATLPIGSWFITLVQLMSWITANIAGMFVILLAPTLALLVASQRAPAVSVIGIISIFIYMLLVLFLAGWIHLIALRKSTVVSTFIQALFFFFSYISIIMTPNPAFSSYGFTTILHPIRSYILGLVSIPLWPSMWVAYCVNGNAFYLLPLIGLTLCMALISLPRLSRYWEQEALPITRPSLYPTRFFKNTRWTTAKFFCLQAYTDPALRLLPQIVISCFIPILSWYIIHSNVQAVLLVGIAYTSRSGGRQLYSSLQNMRTQIEEAAFPVEPFEYLRGFMVALVVHYLPSVLVIFGIIVIFSPSLAVLPGFLLTLVSIGTLAYCAWKNIAPFYGFLAMFGIIVMAACMFF